MYSVLVTFPSLLAFLVAVLFCCMLYIFTRLGASLRLFPAKGSQLPLPRAHLSRTRLSTAPRRPQQSGSAPRHPYGYLVARSYTTQTMFGQAIQKHNAVSAATAPPATSNPASKQLSLAHTLNRTVSTQRPGTRPTTFGASSLAKKNAAGVHRSPPELHGTKRTSSGLAKSWSSNEDVFEYPTLKISELDKENDFYAYRTPSRSNSGSLATALFDEDDFDSDIDLDVEDPATKGTFAYPKLPPVSPTATKDSGHSSRPQSVQPKIELGSSQPIPWSSSPVEHFKTPPKPPPTKSKRRALPWPQQTQPKQQLTPEPEEDLTTNKKRKSAAATNDTTFTPQSKAPSKSQYPWNTTASAIKLQQKTLREQHKAKVAESVDDTENVKRKKKNDIAKMFLSDEQKNVLDLVIAHKKSVFFTGSAGTGKSVLLREIISGLRKKFIREPDRVAVTASTGLAACNIGGVTIHSFSGIGLGKEPAEDLVKKIRRNAKAKQRWLRTKVLVVDEVSMVDGDLFDKLEQIARTIRNNGRPFGGIQLVITGDFFQLPPVPEFGKASKFAFDAGTWTTSIEHTIGLHHVFRQKDPVFAAMLNEMREGRMSSESIANFRKLERPLPASEGNIEATELFPTRMEVDRANTLRMQQLHGDTFSFEARDGGTITNKEQRDRLLQNCMVPEVVHLKKGAQVMLVKNMDDTLVNGSLGKVIGFMTEQQFTFWKENEEDMLQGNITEAQMKTEMAKTVLGLNTAQVFPLIRFAIADGTTRDLLCKREDWKVELPNGEVQASRSQIPLILAWALSIHKAQGQTLERVRVDLGRVFEKGQAYVALSRATSMAGLQILRFDPRKIMAHEKVRSFYNSLSRAEQVEAKAKSETILGKMQTANEKARKRRGPDDED